jgi:hypothetical protein
MWDLLHLSLLIIPLVIIVLQYPHHANSELGGSVQIEAMPLLEAIKTDLNIWRDILLFLTQILIFAFIIIYIFLLIKWMCDSEGLRITPFENTTNDSKYNGKAISDSLIAELQRIFRIYQMDREEFEAMAFPENLSRKENFTSTIVDRSPVSMRERAGTSNAMFPELAKSNESLDIGIAGMGSINVAGTSVPLGQLLINLKRMWPINIGSQKNCVICGSLQKYGSLFRLVVIMEKNREVSVWEVSRRIIYDYQIPTLVMDMAFKIAKDLLPNIPAAKSARTCEGFKHYTNALDNYNQYIWTGRTENLEGARVNCIDASKIEMDYELIFDLFYMLGVTYRLKKEYGKSEEMFRYAVGYKSGSEAINFDQI